MSQNFGPRPPRDETVTFIRACVEPGLTLFGPAELYGPFRNEELVGEALRPFRGKVVIATNVGAGRKVSHSGGGGSQRSLQLFTVLSGVKTV